jgi:uncharacterized protein involved in exopolysaccharide biosynthesis
MQNNNKSIEINVLDVLLVVSKRKRIIFAITSCFVIIAIIMALTSEKQYMASTVLLPKEDEVDMLSSYMKGMSLSKSKLGGNIFSPANDAENMYISILKSRRLQLDVIQKFDLINVYEFKKNKLFFEDVLRAFSRHTKFAINDEGNLSINVIDVSPQRAADITNYMTQKLDEIHKELSTESARNRRVFLEDRLQLTKETMSHCEDSLALFQIHYGLVDLDEQAKATIEAASTMEARILTMQMDLNMAKKIYNTDNQKINELEMNLQELKKQRASLEETRQSDLMIPLKLAPELGLQFFRLKRNLKVQEMIFEILTQQFEAAKLEEAKQTPHVQILDKAIPPQKRIKPKRTLMVAIGFLLGLAFSFGYIGCSEYIGRMKSGNDENYQKIKLLFRNLLK